MKMISLRAETVPYIDANALAAAFFEKGEKGEKAKAIMEKGCTVSALSIDEFLWVARKLGKKDYIFFAYELLRNPVIEFVSVLSTNALRASELMEQYNLKPRDAMHVAIMQDIGATEIVSSDSDFDRIPGMKRIAL